MSNSAHRLMNGFTSMWARLYAPDAVRIEQRVDQMARAVCEDDPRTLAERRVDALTALAASAELACACGESDCAAGQRDHAPAKTAMVYVLLRPHLCDLPRQQAPVSDTV